MNIFLTGDDFKSGEYKIAQNNNLCDEDLDHYIQKYEIIITQELLGCKMSEDFFSDYNSTTGMMNSTAFQDIFLPICEDLNDISFSTYNYNDYSYSYYGKDFYKQCNNILRNDGYLDMLKGFIFFYYMRDFAFKRTLTGVTSLNNENSNNATFSQWGLHNSYNKAVKNYRVIQEYICRNKGNFTEYDNFNGIRKNYTSYF